MGEKKHIDRLFQEKFKNFEATPDPAMWDAIAEKLDHKNKKRRRIIPLWIKLSGVAAGLLLLFMVGRTLFINTSEDSSQPVLVEEESSTIPVDAESLDAEMQDALLESTEAEQVSTADNEISNTSKEAAQSTNSTNTEVANTAVNKANIESSNSLADQKPQKADSNFTNTDKAVANKDAKTKSSQQENELLLNRPQKDVLSENTSDSKENSTSKVANTNTAKDAENALNLNKDLVKETNETNVAAVTNENKEEEGALDIEKAIEEQKLNEEALIEDEEANRKRWSVAPNIAPVYFNTLGSGSSIDGQFNSNSKSGNIDMSYGVAVNYELNNKLKLRAGVNRLDIGYNTNNVIVYNNPEPLLSTPPLKNVRMNSQGQMLSFLSADGLNFAQVPAVVSQNISSSIDQELGFIEIPLEVAYTLSDRKLGLDLIGGFSTLILNKNEIYGSIQGQRTLLGEATNINETSFSANLGIGLNYAVSKQVNLKLEPTFKYQLNTFTDTTGDFQPFVFGVYTGFNFKF